MKVVITGATGFVGPWLQRELAAAGHAVQAAPPSRELDVADGPALAEFLADSAPDAVAHLAAVANAPAAEADPGRALRTNLGGTIALLEAARVLRPAPCLLVVSSAEVYGPPQRADQPLSERSPIAPRGLYALTKAGQEAAATAGATRYGLRLAIARPFNHAGPGQPPLGAVAAFAARVADVQRGASRELATGNLDVERDISDVRDVVRAYRLLLEAMADGTLADSPSIFNVASGTGTSLRWIVDELCRLADVAPPVVTAPELVRRDDPPRIVGDATALRDAVGWQPQIPLTRTLADMLASSARRPAPQPA